MDNIDKAYKCAKILTDIAKEFKDRIDFSVEVKCGEFCEDVGLHVPCVTAVLGYEERGNRWRTCTFTFYDNDDNYFHVKFHDSGEEFYVWEKHSVEIDVEALREDVVNEIKMLLIDE